jgi:hypothetical protein
MSSTMAQPENTSRQSSRTVLTDRRFLACSECGWVHYVMTAEEKAESDRFLVRYQLNEAERLVYEAAFRQCLRCESPASEFEAAEEGDLARAAGHVVTPVLVDFQVGTN